MVYLLEVRGDEFRYGNGVRAAAFPPVAAVYDRRRARGNRAPDDSGSAVIDRRYKGSYSAGCQAFSCHQAATESRLPRNMLRSAFLMLAIFFG